MARIISLETASTNCSVSVYDGDVLLALREDPSPAYTHGELLHVFMEEAMSEAGLQWSALQAVAVSRGPGSYTGLRIGVAAAKGLCFSLGIPLIAVETLRSMAFQLQGATGVLIPMLDARRMEAYVAVFDARHHQIGPTRAEVITPDSFSSWASKGPVHLLGNGAAKCRGLLTHPNFHFHTELQPGSREIGLLAAGDFQAGRFEDVAYFEPLYLKDFILPPKKKR
jgi:tRNA threonylcarbamoyladenosine biosynthesis protein TsaB